MDASVIPDDVENPSADCVDSAVELFGGSVRTYYSDSEVDSVEVLLSTDGRPLNARIELTQGPDYAKQVMELYSEDGLGSPFFCVLETPGVDHVVRIVNSDPDDLPISASIVPHSIDGLRTGGPRVRSGLAGRESYGGHREGRGRRGRRYQQEGRYLEDGPEGFRYEGRLGRRSLGTVASATTSRPFGR